MECETEADGAEVANFHAAPPVRISPNIGLSRVNLRSSPISAFLSTRISTML